MQKPEYEKLQGKYNALCKECGEKVYSNHDHLDAAITVRLANCPLCGLLTYLIPKADWEGYGD